MKKLPQKTRQWLWFCGLWCAGLLAALVLGRTVKFLMFWQL